MRHFFSKRGIPLLLMTAILLSGFGGALAVGGPPPTETAPGLQKTPRESSAAAEPFAEETGAAVPESEPAGEPFTLESEPAGEPSDLEFQPADADTQPETFPSDPAEDEPGEREAAPEPKAPAARLNRDRHVAYLSGSDGAFPSFQPSAPLTRAQTAQLFFLLLDEPAPQNADYTDVPENAWYAPAARAMGTLGVMSAEEGAFRPEETLTRAEFTRCLACFFPPRGDGVLFSDVPDEHPDAEAIRSAQAYGWIQSGDCFRPDDPILRVEAVAMLNRALGRAPDRSYIDRARPVFYVDADPAAWYYYEIVEASVPHEYIPSGSGGELWRSHIRPQEEPETGFAVANGQIYYYDRRRGDVLRNETLEALRFNAQGVLLTDSPRLRQTALRLVQEQNGSPLDPAGLSALLAEAAQSEWYLILVNRSHPLPEDFTIPEFTTLADGYRIDSRVAPALESFLSGARAAGYRPLVCSAYRTRAKQTELFERRVRSFTSRGRSRADAENAASFWVARPDTSEHQAGLAVDIIDSGYQVLNKSQENRPVQQWLMAHCAEYGFILRYPTDKSELTGVGYEPWHYRYVGVEAAQEIMSRGICLEEYLGEA